MRRGRWDTGSKMDTRYASWGRGCWLVRSSLSVMRLLSARDSV